MHIQDISILKELAITGIEILMTPDTIDVMIECTHVNEFKNKIRM